MQPVTIGRVIRALRHRRGWRQADLARRAGVSRSVLSDLEAGRVDHHTLHALSDVARAVGATLRIDLFVPGGDLSRLLDADHAAMQEAWHARLSSLGWSVDAEATFNHYGERGSIDLLAWHPTHGIAVVVEIKTVIVDVQDLLASLDRKARIGRVLTAERGWQPRELRTMLVIAEGTTARRRLAEHTALFARWSIRGRAANLWLRDPLPSRASSGGLLCFWTLPSARRGDRRRAGRQRIRSSRVA